MNTKVKTNPGYKLLSDCKIQDNIYKVTDYVYNRLSFVERAKYTHLFYLVHHEAGTTQFQATRLVRFVRRMGRKYATS